MPNLVHDEQKVSVETCRYKDFFGNLFLTDRRLIFEHENGIFTKRVYVTLDLPLEGVSSASIEGRLGKKLMVNPKKGFVTSFPVRLDFTVEDPSARYWQSRIKSTSEARMESIELNRKEKRVNSNDSGFWCFEGVYGKGWFGVAHCEMS